MTHESVPLGQRESPSAPFHPSAFHNERREPGNSSSHYLPATPSPTSSVALDSTNSCPLFFHSPYSIETGSCHPHDEHTGSESSPSVQPMDSFKIKNVRVLETARKCRQAKRAQLTSLLSIHATLADRIKDQEAELDQLHHDIYLIELTEICATKRCPALAKSCSTTNTVYEPCSPTN